MEGSAGPEPGQQWPEPRPQTLRTPPARWRTLTTSLRQRRRRPYRLRPRSGARGSTSCVQEPGGTGRDENYISQNPLRSVQLTGPASRRQERTEVWSLTGKAGSGGPPRESGRSVQDSPRPQLPHSHAAPAEGWHRWSGRRAQVWMSKQDRVRAQGIAERGTVRLQAAVPRVIKQF